MTGKLKVVELNATIDQFERLQDTLQQLQSEGAHGGRPGKVRSWILLVEREDDEMDRFVEHYRSGGVYLREHAAVLAEAQFVTLARITEGVLEDDPTPMDEGS